MGLGMYGLLTFFACPVSGPRSFFNSLLYTHTCKHQQGSAARTTPPQHRRGG